MVVAKSHIIAQRGHEAGIAASNAVGSTISGSQLSHVAVNLPAAGAARCCTSAIGAFELMVSFRAGFSALRAT